MAIAYDFDGTLAPGNMQEHSFLPELGIEAGEFWARVKESARKNDMDEILSYMSLMLHEALNRHVRVSKQAFVSHGKGLPLYPGVAEWFPRINQYARTKGVRVQHYIISSGLREIIAGTSIAKYFDFVFASGFLYDQHDVAVWPALAVNYTTKTQHLFRINKGIINSYDNTTINKYVPEQDRPLPFRNMIYIGDGETDIPSMKMVKYQGGYAIAVYDPAKRKQKHKPSAKQVCLELIDQQRADYALPADYSDGADLDRMIKSVIDKLEVESRLQSIGKK
jgi:hypothetical protein